MAALAQPSCLLRHRGVEVIMACLLITHKQAGFHRLKGIDCGLCNQLRNLVQINCLAARSLKALDQPAIMNLFVKKQAIYEPTDVIPEQGSKQGHGSSGKDNATYAGRKEESGQ